LIYLVDREPYPSRVAASWDWNKVVRAEYTDIVYMELALEAKQTWATDPLFKPFYHESGILWISDGNFAQTVAENYKILNATEELRVICPNEAKSLYDGLFAEADYTGVTEVIVNPNSGWAAAKEALTAVIDAAVRGGVKYVSGVVSAIEFESNGCTKGIRFSDGRTISASYTILSTGAGTGKLLADSGPERDELQPSERLVAAAVCTGLVKLDTETAEKISKGPVCCQHTPPRPGLSRPGDIIVAPYPYLFGSSS